MYRIRHCASVIADLHDITCAASETDTTEQTKMNETELSAEKNKNIGMKRTLAASTVPPGRSVGVGLYGDRTDWQTNKHHSLDDALIPT